MKFRLSQTSCISNNPLATTQNEFRLEDYLILKGNDDFEDYVRETYYDIMAFAYIEENIVGKIPSVSEISDRIDERNLERIENLVNADEEEIDHLQAEYFAEYSCLMEDWVESALQNFGYCYVGSSALSSYINKSCYAPQNIMFEEFLR